MFAEPLKFGSRRLWCLKWFLASPRTCCSLQTSSSRLFTKVFYGCSLDRHMLYDSQRSDNRLRYETFILHYVDKLRCVSMQDAAGQLAASANTFPSLLRELSHIIANYFYHLQIFPWHLYLHLKFIHHCITRWSYSLHKRHIFLHTGAQFGHHLTGHQQEGQPDPATCADFDRSGVHFRVSVKHLALIVVDDVKCSKIQTFTDFVA